MTKKDESFHSKCCSRQNQLELSNFNNVKQFREMAKYLGIDS